MLNFNKTNSREWRAQARLRPLCENVGLCMKNLDLDMGQPENQEVPKMSGSWGLGTESLYAERTLNLHRSLMSAIYE